MSTPVISVSNVTKVFDGGDNRVVALDNVTMHVDRHGAENAPPGSRPAESGR